MVLVFDISSRRSFLSCLKWLHYVRGFDIEKTSAPIDAILIGNKNDLREEKDETKYEVETHEAEAFAKENGIEYFECSAMNGCNIKEPFQFVAEFSRKRHQRMEDE